MNCIRKGILEFFIIALLLFIFATLPAYAGEKEYGVKIGNQEDGYQLCKNLTVLSPNKNVMVKAKAICKELGFKYSYNSRTKKLTISNESNQSMAFTVGSKNYYIYYFMETTGHKETAAYQCYYDKTSKSYVIPMAVLKSMVGYQYYKLSDNDYYGKQGYKGMFFCSSTDLWEPSKEIMLTDNLADQIVAEEVTENMTDVEKVKALNDYMALNCEYDDTLSKHSPYDILVTGQGVCLAYAEAYHLLLTKAGIKDYIIEGSAGTDTLEGHAWNIVKLGKDYYHVDTTWNETDYGYFLLSDKAISKDHVWNSSRFPACKKGLSENEGRIEEMLGDYFYVTEIDYETNHFRLLRIKYDGTDRTLLLDIEYQKYSPVHCFDDNNFYYATWEEGLRFYKLDIKTNATEEILSDSNLDWGEIAVHNEYIYMYYTDRIIRINTITKEQQNLYEVTANNVNIFYLDIVADRVIFKTSKYDETPIIIKKYQMNFDGTGLKELSRW